MGSCSTQKNKKQCELPLKPLVVQYQYQGYHTTLSVVGVTLLLRYLLHSVLLITLTYCVLI